MLKKITDRLADFMKSENSMRLLVLAGLGGLVCILLSSFFSGSDEESDILPDEAGNESLLSDTASEYADVLEQRLESILTEIDGVGSCSVMVTVSGSSSYSYAQNAEQQYGENIRETKRQHVILDEKSGDSPLVECVRNPEIVGVIIACEGGDHNVVREEIISAVGAVLEIPSNRICVAKKNH